MTDVTTAPCIDRDQLRRAEALLAAATVTRDLIALGWTSTDLTADDPDDVVVKVAWPGATLDAAARLLRRANVEVYPSAITATPLAAAGMTMRYGVAVYVHADITPEPGHG